MMRDQPMKAYKPYYERQEGPFDEYDVRNALETLVRARAIGRNKKLLRAVRAEALKQQKAAQENIKLTGGK